MLGMIVDDGSRGVVFQKGVRILVGRPHSMWNVFQHWLIFLLSFSYLSINFYHEHYMCL